MVCLGYVGMAVAHAAAIPIDLARSVRCCSFGRGKPSDRPTSNSPPSRLAFTLIELLTVIAVLAVLATLLLTALSSAQKRSRQARCVSNLHQTSLALQMYMDDSDRRPAQLTDLVRTKYLANREILVCPEDKTGNWGELASASGGLGGTGTFQPTNRVMEMDWMPYSYVHPLTWDDTAWDLLLKAGSLAGIASCQVHGLGRANLLSPSVHDFEGLVLRAQRDGAVVRRKVFWARDTTTVVIPGDGETGATTAVSGADSNVFGIGYPWPLFSDETSP